MAIAVTVKKDAKARNSTKKRQMIKISGQKASMLCFSLASICNITARLTPSISWGINATARSETARLRNKFFKVVDMDESFRNARITRRFPRVATMENIKFNTERTSIDVL